MRSFGSTMLALVMLAAMVFPAVGTASVNACIAACASGMMPADSACAEPPHAAERVSASGACCHAPETPAPQECAASTRHSAGSCDCATCSLAPSRFFVKQSPIKLPPVFAALVPQPMLLPAIAMAHRESLPRAAYGPPGPSRALLCVYQC